MNQRGNQESIRVERNSENSNNNNNNYRTISDMAPKVDFFLCVMGSQAEQG